MSCPTPLTLSLHVGRALAAEQMAAVERHCAVCERCAAALAGLRGDDAVLRALLQAEDRRVPIPPLERPLRARALLVAAAGATGAAALAGHAWSAIAAAVPAPLRWLDSVGPALLGELSSALLFHFTREGTAMIEWIGELAAAVLLLGILGAAWLARARRGVAASTLIALAAFGGVIPERGDALEIRRGEGLLSVAAGETIDDTLMIFGESVSIDGNVTGDVIAFARRVTVRGDIGGDLVAGAELVTLEGTVGGNVFSAGRTVTLAAARVDGNVYGVGGDVALRTGADVSGNAVLGGNTVAVHGRVGVDLLSFAQSLELGGTVGRDVDAFGQDVTVLPQARIGGDLLARLPDERNLRRAGGATVAGAVDTRVTERPAARNRYLTASFYVRQAIWLGAAFLTGLLLLTLVPALRTAPLATAGQAARAAGFGLVTAAVLPVAAVIAFITIFGIPLGVAALVAWLLGLYLAKIVVAQQVGRMLFQAPHGVPHHAATLIAGLIVVLIAINLPWLGGIANLLLTLTGLGLIAASVLRRLRPPAAA